MKLNAHLLAKRIVFLIDVALLLAACTTSTPTPVKETTEGFAIYLPARKIAADEILKVNLDNLELGDRPIVSIDDIVAYSKDTHEIELTPLAYERIKSLKVPTTGIPFVVCVDRQPVYGGAFWVGYSSQSFEGVVIDTLGAEQKLPIRIQLGYPESPELFVGQDRRSDARIMQALEKAGKLK